MWCKCDQCGSNIRDGVCWDCNYPTYDQRSFNNPSNDPDYYPTPPPPSFNCYICENPSEEGMSCGRCFCNECGYTNCMCHAPSADTSYAHDPSFEFYPQNFYEQDPHYNGDSFQIHPILSIVGDRLKILITNQIHITILMVFTNPHNLPILLIKFLKSNP